MKECDAIVINIKDNVAIALSNLNEGQIIEVLLEGKVRKIKLRDNIKFLHKLALQNFDIGEKILKYGNVIGAAAKKIKTGDHVHTQNMKSLRG